MISFSVPKQYSIFIFNVININTCKMVSLTLSVSGELKRKMEEFPEMNWSEVARQAIRRRLVLLERMNSILVESELSEKDAVDLGRRLNESLAKRT